MKYMLLAHSDRAALDSLDEGEQKRLLGEFLAIGDSPGVTESHQLRPADTATTVRVLDGRVLATDGPFIEAKEELGGYYICEADDLDAAIELAARIAGTRIGGAVEVRPVVER
jgi:hypothetical protein